MNIHLQNANFCLANDSRKFKIKRKNTKIKKKLKIIYQVFQQL